MKEKWVKKVAVAESNIICVIDFDFEVDFPNKSLYELAGRNFKGQYDLLSLAKVLVLDVFRTGCSLFYDSQTISLSCLLLANYLLNGSLKRQFAASEPEHFKK